MKKIYLPLSFICLALFAIVAGCATVPSVDPASFIGTKWVGIISFMGERNTLEFIDETTCIYTFYGEPLNRKYRIKGDKLIMGRDTYVIQGDVLFLNGYGYWAKE